MTNSNIVTLPGMAPRQPPASRIDHEAMDDVRRQCTLSHWNHMMHAVQYIAKNESPDKAIEKLHELIDLIRQGVVK